MRANAINSIASPFYTRLKHPTSSLPFYNSMSNSSVPLYQVGDIVPFHFSAPIIVASCLVSLLGCITTVELLHRKKRARGWTNWFNQLAISVSFGLVGIWCMHFVGNRAIILGNGDKTIQLDYNPGFTALSVFLPIIFLFVALTLFELRQPSDRTFWPILLISGFIAGLSITGMHYVGNFGISNYRCRNPAPYIVGAGAIAIVASIVAFSLFFYFREKWVNSFPKRMASSCLLAGAVSGMHWLASIGTTYTLKKPITASTKDTRNINLIVAIICAVLACAVCLTFAISTQRRRRRLADRAQHVVLASMTFDSQGRILVTEEGLPPCRKVTKQFNQKSFDDEFNVAHPVFQWLYRVTYNWNAVADLVPRMRSHLRAVGFIKDRASRVSRPSTRATLSTWDDLEIENDYSILFREYFCVAADDLAGMLDTRIQDLGLLYNGIMTTGSSGDYKTKKKGQPDAEKGTIFSGMFGNGQLLFLVRTVDKVESARLVTQGFRFAYPKNVSEIVARNMRVTHSDIVDVMERLQIYSQPRRPLASGGTYLSCFAIRATVKSTSRSWDILVPTDRPGDLPFVELSDAPLTTYQSKCLHRLDGLTVSQSITFLNNIASEVGDVEHKAYIEHLLDMITELTHQVPENFFKQATFSANAVAVPHLAESSTENKPPQMFAFSVIPDVHSASAKSTAVTYVPLAFFQCIQRVYKNSPDHAILAHRIHREFGTILSQKNITPNLPGGSSISQSNSPRASISHFTSRRAKSASRRFSSHFPSLNSRHSRLSEESPSGSPSSDGPGSEKTSGDAHDLIEELKRTAISNASNSLAPPSATASSGPSPSTKKTTPAFGGIMVSSDTKVEVFETVENAGGRKGNEAVNGVRGGDTWGTTSDARAEARNEAPTYVDELFKIASSRWQRR